MKTNGMRWALAATALAVTVALGLSLGGGRAQAQCQGGTTYCIPTPTPTPTGTPFVLPPPPPPARPSSGPKLMSPFPVVRTAGSFAGGRTAFSRFTVKGPIGTRVVARCKRSRCKVRRTLRTRKLVHLRPLERSFKAGTRITLRLTASSVIGKYVEIRVRRGKPPLRRDLCLTPGRSKPVSCGTESG